MSRLLLSRVSTAHGCGHRAHCTAQARSGFLCTCRLSWVVGRRELGEELSSPTQHKRSPRPSLLHRGIPPQPSSQKFFTPPSSAPWCVRPPVVCCRFIAMFASGGEQPVITPQREYVPDPEFPRPPRARPEADDSSADEAEDALPGPHTLITGPPRSAALAARPSRRTPRTTLGGGGGRAPIARGGGGAGGGALGPPRELHAGARALASAHPCMHGF